VPPLQNFLRLFSREQQGAREDLGQRQQVELERGNDTEAAPASSQGPEQIRLILRINADLLAISRDQLDRTHPVAGEAVFAMVETDTAAKCVAGDANVRARAVQRSQTEFRRPGHHVTPECTGADSGLGRIGIDLNAGEGSRAQQDGVGERTKRRRIVPGALGGDPLADGGCGADDLAHLVGALRHRDSGWLLDDQDVEGSTFQVPVSVLSGQQLSGHNSPSVVRSEPWPKFSHAVFALDDQKSASGCSRHQISGCASTPASLRCSGVIGAGASVSGSTPPPDFGNAITSRMESVRDNSAQIRSQPNAMPPCGGGP
jgi:hypothetical protein